MTVSVRQQAKAMTEMGPCMLALPNDRWRNFVVCLVTGKPGHGSATRAYKEAGFESSTRTATVQASRMVRDERILAAIGEESRKWLRAGHPHAVAALHKMVANSKHKDHARAVEAVLARVDPITTNQFVHVTRVDNTGEALIERIKVAAAALGIDPQQFLGVNTEPKLIEGEIVEVDVAGANSTMPLTAKPNP
jgi:phage terminase small subunit